MIASAAYRQATDDGWSRKMLDDNAGRKMVDDIFFKDDNLGLSGAMVKIFIASYLKKEHIFYTDNWYTSPSLSVYLA